MRNVFLIFCEEFYYNHIKSVKLSYITFSKTLSNKYDVQNTTHISWQNRSWNIFNILWWALKVCSTLQDESPSVLGKYHFSLKPTIPVTLWPVHYLNVDFRKCFVVQVIFTHAISLWLFTSEKVENTSKQWLLVLVWRTWRTSA